MCGTSSSSSESMGLSFFCVWQIARLHHFRLGFLSFFVFCVTCAVLWVHSFRLFIFILTGQRLNLRLSRREVQHVGAAGQIVEVFVEVYTHVIWIFFVFLSDLVAQLEVIVLLMMRDSQLWDPHLDL